MNVLSDVKDYEHANATSEIAPGDWAILLLAGRVPYLQFNDFVIDPQELLTKFNANRVLWIVINWK